MSLIHSYALWNNKGGVGKSTVTYNLATRYAEKNPDKKVLVIDLCPQANASMMLLGGSNAGEHRVLNYCTASEPKTVVGYVSAVMVNGVGAALPDPNDFLVQVSRENSNLPKNLFLLCGDVNLESTAPAISATLSQPHLSLATQPWKWVHTIFKCFIDNLTDSKEQWMVFVDTNPSFSIYTQMAISSVERLLVPVNADDSSRVAFRSLCALLHGTNPPHPVYGDWTYASQAAKHGIEIPKVHLIIGNRLTLQDGAAAQPAVTDETAGTMYGVYRNSPTYFTKRDATIRNSNEFREIFSVALHDFNTTGVICAHLGKLLSTMSQGTYTIYNSETKVNTDKILECKKAIDKIIKIIG